MAHKALRFSAHALERLASRGISRSMVRKTLALGDKIALVGQASLCRERRFGSRVLRVIYLEGSGARYVLTVMWKQRLLKEVDDATDL